MSCLYLQKLLELITKNSYFNNYLKKFFSQAYSFIFFSSQNSFPVKQIVLTFSPVRTAFFSQSAKLLPQQLFLSIYRNIIGLLDWHSKFKKSKALKKKISEELMPIVWYPKRCWNFCMREDEKKAIEPIFTE